MEYTRIYIGSNNDTKILELDKIQNILNIWLESYTIIQAVGVWKGTKENTAIVEIYGTYNLGIIEILKRELKQDAILVVNNFLEVNFK